MASQLTAVQNFGLQLQKKEQQMKLLLEKNEGLEDSLARAENRITQLSLQARKGQHALAGEGAIVSPGVSKKVLEALTRENTKLRQAFDHLSRRGQSGVDLAVENRDLQALKNQVMRLSTQVTKLERNLNAKQVFCETIVTENEELKTKLQSLKDGKFFNKVREMKKELGDLTRTQADIKPAFRSQLQVSNEGADQKGEQKQDVYKSLMAENHQLHDRLLMLVTEGKKMASQSPAGDENLHPGVQTKAQSKNKLLLEKYKQLEAFLVRTENKMMQMRSPADNCCRPRHLFTREEAIVDPDSSKKVLEALTSENTKLRKAVDHLTKRGSSGVDLAVHSAWSEDVHSFKRDKRKLMEEVQALRKEIDDPVEVIGTQTAQQQSFEVYEDDFKSERDERVKALSDQEKVAQERDHLSKSQEQLMRENMALREEIELMCKQRGETALTGATQMIRRELDEKEAQLVELQMELELLKKTFEVYEDDFKSERDKRVKALSDQEKIAQERDHLSKSQEQLMRENMALREDIELMCKQLANYEDDFKSERAEKIKALSDREKITRERDYIYEELKKEQQHMALGESTKQSKVARRYRRPGYRGTSEAQLDLQCPRSRARGTDGLALGEDISDLPPNPSREMPTPSPQRCKEAKKRKLERGHRDSTKSLYKRDRQIRGAASEKPCCSKHCFGSHCSTIVTMIVPVRPET